MTNLPFSYNKEELEFCFQLALEFTSTCFDLDEDGEPGVSMKTFEPIVDRLYGEQGRMWYLHAEQGEVLNHDLTNFMSALFNIFHLKEFDHVPFVVASYFYLIRSGHRGGKEMH